MKKIVQKSLAALFIVFLFGTFLASCGPIFNVGGDDGDGDNGGGNPTPPVPPSGGYTAVKATDWTELVEYLESPDTSYAITLDMESSDIYLQKSVSIVRQMKIIGNFESAYTIHSVTRAGGNVFYCLDLQANLEMEYCSFTGYNGTSGAVNGIAAGSPPLNIRAGKTLTITGTNSVLELRGVGNGADIRTGSQVILTAGASILDESGDLLFKSGVEKLVISGKIPLNKKLTVGSGGVLQIESGGELRVGSGTTLTLNNDLKELKLGGNIVVDRTTGNSVGNLEFSGGLTMDSLLEKITGNGSLTIENGIPQTTTKPFGYGANTTIKMSSDSISLGKRVSGIGGVINTTDDLTIPMEKKLIVSAGAELNVSKELILKGGTLEVAGNVNVVSGGQISVNAEDRFNAIPKGMVQIGGSGIITVNKTGTITDKSVSWGTKILTLPLDLYDTNSLITIKSGPAFTLTGKATLTVPPGGLALEGRFNIAAGAELTVNGGNILTVKAPNQLTGTITNPAVVQLKIIAANTKVAYYTAGNDPGEAYEVGDYKWDGPPDGWDK